MTASFGYMAMYVVLVGIASFAESPVGRGFGAFQLNVLIRSGSLAAALVALLVHGFGLPEGSSALAGLGVGLITGVGSLFYCFALDYLSVSLVVTFSNLYIVVTTLLGIVVLGEHITVLKVAGLACILVGVVLLSHTHPRYGTTPKADSMNTTRRLRGYLVMVIYVVLVGVGAFLEKPALKGLDATQLNGLMALSMTAVAVVALALRGPRLPMTKRSLGGFGVGAMIGVASIFYFLALRQLPVSVAAASSNASVIITVLLASVFMHQALTRARVRGIILTLVGVTGLALSTG